MFVGVMAPVLWFCTESRPSSPKMLEPQQRRPPLTMTHACAVPSATFFAPAKTFVTALAVPVCVVPPDPSRFDVLLPQQKTKSGVTAHECCWLAVIVPAPVASAGNAVTAFGVRSRWSASLPPWNALLSPQQKPFDLIDAHVVCTPAPIASGRPGTGTTIG